MDSQKFDKSTMRSEHSRRRELVKERKREKTRGVRLKNKCLVWSGLVPMLCVHRSLMEYADENMHWDHIIKGSCFERCSDGVLQEMWLVFWALEKHCHNSVVGRSIWRQFKWAIESESEKTIRKILYRLDSNGGSWDSNFFFPGILDFQLKHMPSYWMLSLSK